MLNAACARQSPAQSNVDAVAASSYNQKLAIGNKNLKVEIVSTPEKMALGLSGREKMADDEGMLFVFNSRVTPSFWMKDMKFNLDFLWISNGKIIGITKNVFAPLSPTLDKDLPVYTPPAPVDSVLEVNAGWAEKNRIAVGNEVKIE